MELTVMAQDPTEALRKAILRRPLAARGFKGAVTSVRISAMRTGDPTTPAGGWMPWDGSAWR